MLTIVMYHYVRPIKDSAYPEIRGLELNSFLNQLDYLNLYYTFVTIKEVIAHYTCNDELPSNAVLLTFDDGYIDHYKYVFPELLKRSISGAFFPPSKCIVNRKILDVNKIHYILASEKNKNNLIKDINKFIVENQKRNHLKFVEEYNKIYMKSNTWDTPEVSYIKSILQHVLPEKSRKILADQLFTKYVSENEKGFSEQIYMTPSQLREMIECGMHIGGHGARHLWLEHLPYNKQHEEIEASFRLLSQIYDNKFDFTFCYPYGSYNEDTLKILQDKKCCLGFTTNFDVCNLHDKQRLQLPRLDTNHLPKKKKATPNDWTMRVINSQ